MPDARPPLDLSPYFLDLQAIEPPLSWPELFGNNHPVELEIGPGKGFFLVNAALQNPDRNFCGVELSRKYARKAAERAAKRGLSNVKVFVGDARRFLSEYVPNASLKALHVYFPDPWWKKRHKKRRVFNETLVDHAERALQTGGDLQIATDVEEYFEVMTALVATHRRFFAQPPPPPSTPEHDLDYLTNFERKFRLEGRPIFRARYRLS